MQSALFAHLFLLAKSVRVIHCVGEKGAVGVMPVSCCTVNCTNRFKRDSGIGFYMIPAKLVWREAWLRAISWAGWEAKSSDCLAANILWSAGLLETLRTSITYPHSSRMASGEQIAVYLIETGRKGGQREPRCAKTKQILALSQHLCNNWLHGILYPATIITQHTGKLIFFLQEP